jgi:hypothetical protein
MQVVSLRKMLFAAVVVLALFPMLQSAPAPNPAVVVPEPSPAERVREKLAESVTVSIPAEWTFGDALDYLTDKYNLRFAIDDRAFAAKKLDNVRGVNIGPGMGWQAIDVPLKGVLKNILDKGSLAEKGATYVIINKTIIITTADWAPYRWLHQLVTVDCQKEPLSSVLKRLAHETGTNLVLDPRAAKEAETVVTLQVHDVTLETAVSLLAEITDFRTLRLGNVLFLTTKANATEMRANKERAALISPFPLPTDVKLPPLP